jgi:hypothetical protein
MTTKISRIVLDLVVDDSYALSEIVSRIRQGCAGLSQREAKQLARTTITRMLDAGWIAITRLDRPGAPEVELDPPDAKSALADDLNWVEPAHWRSHVRVVATSEGEDAYRRL